MSNVIKAYTIRYDNEVIKTIDTHFKIDKEIEERRSLVLTKKELEDGFVEGLTAVVVEQKPSEEEISEKTSKLIEDAKNEAKTIIDNARKEAEKIKNDTYAAAQKKGYEDGIQKSKLDTQKLKAEYDEKSRSLQIEYETVTKALQPQIAQIIIALVEKLTGCAIEDKVEVILYLIENSLKNMDKSNEYIIRVSREDYEYVAQNKELLRDTIGKEVVLHIIQDTCLTRNQCLIETDLKVINCSLDIQLNNLITDLKLIGSI